MAEEHLPPPLPGAFAARRFFDLPASDDGADADNAASAPHADASDATAAAAAESDRLLQLVRTSVIGHDAAFVSPFGRRRVVYADYIASGRALSFLEAYISTEVAPARAPSPQLCCAVTPRHPPLPPCRCCRCMPTRTRRRR